MISILQKTTMILIASFISFSVTAQEPQPNNPKQPVPPARQTADPRDEFVQSLRDIQPKIDELSVRARQNAATNPELLKEVQKLNDMVVAFKSKLENLESAPNEQQEQYVNSLQSEWKTIKAQLDKVQDMSLREPEKSMPQSENPPK